MTSALALDVGSGSGALARDLALFAADVLTLDEVSARNELSAERLLALMEQPALVQKIEKEAVNGKLTGVIGQAKATVLRDKVLDLLAQKINADTSPRVLLDTLNAVKPYTAREVEAKPDTGFRLTVILAPAPPAPGSADVVDVPSRVVLGGDS